MLDEEAKAKIRQLYFAEHFTINAISEALKVHHSTVKRAINYDVFRKKDEGTLRASILDAYKQQIDEKLTLHPKITASRLFQILCDRGYKGSISTLRQFLLTARPKYKKSFLRMVVHPGEQAQVDWAHCGTLKIGNAVRKLYVFVMVLSYSRAVYAEFCLNQSTSTFLRCHERAFEYFGGIPRIILFDNLKSVVLARRGEGIRFNPSILEFSSFYCFEPRPCNVYKGNEKGRVERTIRYLRDNYLSARILTDLPSANATLRHWCDHVANKRHWPGDRAYLVKAMWLKELPHLIKLSGRWLRPKDQITSSARKTPWLQYDLNMYSIPPAYINRPLLISADDVDIEIICDFKVIASHKRSYERGRFIEITEHRASLLKFNHFGRSNLFRESITRDFPAVDKILSTQFERGHDMATLVRKLYELRYEYGDEIFSQAILKSIESQQYSIESLRCIAQQIEKSKNILPKISIVLPERDQVKSLEIKQSPLSTYDNL